ncbi:Homocysteine-responsive endoplasmic reticulum-resident ubiquitin-like domain member 2 protein [Frankliniella fusca]|uniref:Homocysteine-responsive endoplasmic reticulum-resident ubiquitin-like domain member 2 protein n=1 Tax=Frankliniella fusca TaxID=407009 RepID=A0AAE1LQ49_9NEOP|nr:Homocysteine-responsive endoplasmic reticulum-resident ubiquitin-like domain member 2 protein [Frankliniella fusca]
MSSFNMPVTLIVKAPNQQIEDQTIQCELSWTIKRLKGYLSEVYPSKPSTEEQKLIYSGHLLNDSCTLQEVLRTYEEGQDQHTVHLVCARNSMVLPKKTESSATTSESNLRRRNVPGPSTSSDTNSHTGLQTANSSNRSSAGTSSSASSTNTSALSGSSPSAVPTNPPPGAVPTQAAPPQAMPPFYPTPQIPPFAQFPQIPPYAAPPQVIPWTQAQYAAWMHQAYAQYMAQYMHMMSQGSGNPFQWQVPPNVSVRGPQPNFDQPGAVQGQAGAVERPAGAEEGDDEENAGRDWLDLFYMTSRAAAFFAFVYFYTTPMRFLVVFCLGLLMYLYNIGFFRPLDDFVQVAENNNDPARVDAAAAAANNVNNDNNNNHQPAQAGDNAPAAAQPADGAGGNEEAVQNNPDGGAHGAPAAAAPVGPVPDRPSLLALTWTFFTSFFASLIPEQPGVI